MSRKGLWPFNWEEFTDFFSNIAPLLVTLTSIMALLWIANWMLFRRKSSQETGSRFVRQLIMLVMFFLALLTFIIVIPIDEATRGHVFTLLGILLTGMIALSSTSIVSNIMAGLMLRIVRSFKSGDFIRIDDNFGRVTERGLTHIEIQVEDRDLTTFSNLYVVTHPFTVVRSSGTIISTTLSLGYDLSHSRIEELLIEAAKKTGLSEPFVQVKELGDFSITYRIAGFLADVKRIITTRSDLRKQVLDTLHSSDVEIVSPSFMNQRQIPPNVKILPKSCQIEEHQLKDTVAPEKLIFDKAEEAEALDALKQEYSEQVSLIEELTKLEKKTPDETKDQLQHTIQSAEKRMENLKSEQETLQNRIDKLE